MSKERVIRLGTRGSELALWQTNYVKSRLQEAWPDKQFEIEIFTTRGDVVLDTPLPLIGGKGLFTAELEAALREGAIDFAVHSLKDLPTEEPPGLTIGATPERASVHDVLISRGGQGLAALPAGASIGTSSRRRAAQILNRRPDLKLINIRGNVPTRIAKALDPNGPYAALVLARAGLERLGLLEHITEELPLDVMLPAPGQGALGIQCRIDSEALALLKPIDHADTWAAVTAERAFLEGLGGGCSTPVAAYAHREGNQLRMQVRVIGVDGKGLIEIMGMANLRDRQDTAILARDFGLGMAEQALKKGADKLLNA